MASVSSSAWAKKDCPASSNQTPADLGSTGLGSTHEAYFIAPNSSQPWLDQDGSTGYGSERRLWRHDFVGGGERAEEGGKGGGAEEGGKGGGAEEGGKGGEEGGEGGGAEEGGKRGGAEEGAPHDLGSTGLEPNDLGSTANDLGSTGLGSTGLGPLHWAGPLPLGAYKMIGLYPYWQEMHPDTPQTQGGYLRAYDSEIVEVIDGKVEPGHANNLYSAYVFARPVVQDEMDKFKRQGWVPVELLQFLDGWDAWYQLD